MNNHEEARQPETRAIMSWLRRIHFTASASLHGVIFVILFSSKLSKRVHMLLLFLSMPVVPLSNINFLMTSSQKTVHCC